MATQRSGTNIDDLQRLNPEDYQADDLLVIRSAKNQKAMNTEVSEFGAALKGTSAFMIIDTDTVITENDINLYEFLLADTTGGDILVTLPAVTNIAGKSISIKKIGVANVVNVASSDSATFDGDATAELSGITYPLAGFLCDGSNWWITNA